MRKCAGAAGHGKPPRSRRRAIEQLEPRTLLSGDVLANHNGGLNTGQYSETVLTPADITSTQAGSSISTNFGRLFTTSLDSQIYAHVLARSNVNITRGASQGIHNVLFAATLHDSLYALDASTGAILWQDNFLQIVDPRVTTIGSPVPDTGVTTMPAAAITSVVPELGILATPVIDPASGIVYVEANSKEVRGTDTHWVQRLWAINPSDGSVAISPNNPASVPTSGGQVIGDTIFNSSTFTNFTGFEYVAGPYIKGSGDNGINNASPQDGWVVNAADINSPWGAAGSTPQATGYIAFNALVQMNRSALTLINGVVYIGYASHGDAGPYYGYLLGYSASNLANVVTFVTTPTFEPFSIAPGDGGNFTAHGGIWSSGSPIATDGTYLYVLAGDGAFNVNSNNFSPTFVSDDNGNIVQLPLDNDYGDAVLKLQFDPNANQSNVNVFGGVINNPDGTYDPDGGYNASGVGMKVVDYFVPSNAYKLDQNDADLGSTGVLLIPSSGPGSVTAPNGDPLLAVSGKEGRIYLIDANNFGGFNTQYIVDGNEMTDNDPARYDRVLGEFYYWETLPGNSATKANNNTLRSFGMLSYFNGRFYVSWGANSSANYKPQLGFDVSNFFFSSVPHTGVQPTPSFTTGTTVFGIRGTTASISSNGLSDGILWDIQVTLPSPTDALLAYDTSGNLLFSSNWKLVGASNNSTNSIENGVTGSSGVKFTMPTVYNGMVYVGTGGQSGPTLLGTVVGYGLLAPTLTTPTGLSAVATSSSSIHLAWTRGGSDQETGTRIERSPDGISNWSTVKIVPSGTNLFDDTTVLSSTHYFYRASELYGSSSSLLSTSADAITLVPGDANGDAVVNSVDLGILAAHWQASTAGGVSAGDFTGPNNMPDGKVDIYDLKQLASAWPAAAPPIAALTNPTPLTPPTRTAALAPTRSAAIDPFRSDLSKPL